MDNHLLIGRALGITYRRENRTESYIRIPPALVITDSDGAAWTMGFSYNAWGEINVLRDDVDTGEFAQFVEYNKGLVRLYGRAGWRVCSRNRRHII